MTLSKWVHDPILLGNDPFFKGHGDSRHIYIYMYTWSPRCDTICAAQNACSKFEPCFSARCFEQRAVLEKQKKQPGVLLFNLFGGSRALVVDIRAPFALRFLRAAFSHRSSRINPRTYQVSSKRICLAVFGTTTKAMHRISNM